MNEDGPDKGLFSVEYADVFGIPFNFTGKPVEPPPPKPPRETIAVKAIRPERDALEIRFPRVEGYRVELPEERLTAQFNDESVLTLSPALVGPTTTVNSGLIGKPEDFNVKHLGDVRPSTILFNLTQRLLYTKWRDPGEEPKLHLFGQLKRITKQWLDGEDGKQYLVCKGGTYPGQLMYQELADMACNKITAAITRQFLGERPIKALLDAYNPTGSTAHVRFNTSKTDRWQTSSNYCHINWVILDSEWEASSAAWRSHTPRSAPTSRTTTSAWKCRTATAPKRASTGPTSSCWWTTAAAPKTCCDWWSRSRATAARTRWRRSPRWTPTGSPA
jgi:type III restriction enzyme